MATKVTKDLDQEFVDNFFKFEEPQPEESKPALSRDVYKPSAVGQPEEKYAALVRFMPFIDPISKSGKEILQVDECYFRDVDNDNLVYVKLQPGSKDNPIRKIKSRLWFSNNALDKELSKRIRISTSYYALVRIIKDKNHPELDGQVKIFKFGKGVYEAIMAEKRGSEFASETINPFSPDGRLFEIYLTLKDAKINDKPMKVNEYGQCKFVNKNVPITYGDDNREVDRTKESINEYVQWLEEKGPNIAAFQYTPWDEETKKRVQDNIDTYITAQKGRPVVISTTSKTVEPAEVENPTVASPNTARTRTVNPKVVDDDPLGFNDDNNSEDGDNDIDDFFNSLNA